MAAYHPTTLRTPPLFLLSFKEFIDTIIFNVLQVLYHAHMVESAVALIKDLYSSAWEIPTFIAKSHQPFLQQFTLSFVVTILAAWQATGAVRLPKPLLLQVILHRQVAGTQATVHSTGSD